MENNTWIISEKPTDYKALFSLASSLQSPVTAVWVGNEEGLKAVCECGAENVIYSKYSSDGLYEDAFNAVLASYEGSLPKAILLASTKRLRLAAARLAVIANTKPINDVISISCDNGKIITERMVYGGSALCRESVSDNCAILLVSESLLSSCEDLSPAGQPSVSEVESEVKWGPTLVSRSPREVEAVNLASAKRIVSVGRGIKAKEDLALVEDLAKTMEAEIGCTRPLAEGENWLARERYIGVSGVIAKPDIFLALGLSGQVQHIVGASSSRLIIAVNKEKSAPIFKYADYGIVGDIYEVIPALTRALS